MTSTTTDPRYEYKLGACIAGLKALEQYARINQMATMMCMVQAILKEAEGHGRDESRKC